MSAKVFIINVVWIVGVETVLQTTGKLMVMFFELVVGRKGPDPRGPVAVYQRIGTKTEMVPITR
jgi:hypothetical protein